MVKPGLKVIIDIAPIDVKSAYRYEECEFCAFHDVEPGICEECDDASEFEDIESEDILEAA